MKAVSVEHIALRDTGKPYIAGKGVKVAYIANLYVQHQWSVEQIAEEHDLTPAEVHAALSYYYDHKESIDAQIREADALLEQPGAVSMDELRRRIESQQPGNS